MTDDEHERYRSELKLDMAQALAAGACTCRPCESVEQVLALIKTGEADLLLSVATSAAPITQHYAVRFYDRNLGAAAHEDCLDLYQLREGPSPAGPHGA